MVRYSVIKSLQRIQRICLMGIILGLPLSEIPIHYRIINTFNSLPMLFCIVGIITIFCENLLGHQERTKKIDYRLWLFLITNAIWTITCIVIGAYLYPFYNEVNTLNTMRMERLASLLPFFHGNTFIVVGTAFLNILRALKEEVVLLFGASWLVYHLYHKNWRLGFHDIRSAAIILSVICFLYSIPELIWLWTENEVCENFLKFVNPNLYDVPQPPAWHPPLLWKEQLRSVFDEPSSFGIISSFIFPLLLTVHVKKTGHYIIKSLCLGFYVLMIFCTQSRTALGIFFIEMVCLIFFYLKKRGIYHIKQILILVISIFIGIISYNVFPQIVAYIVPNGHTSATAGLYGTDKNQTYLDRNLTSMTNTTERSNGARYGMTVGSFFVGMNHPWFGVGRGYESLYIEEKLPEFARNNNEINGWMNNCREKGITEMGCFILNQYTNIFATSGILGVVAFLFLPVYCIVKSFKFDIRAFDEKAAILFVILIAQLVGMFSGPYRFTYPIILTLTYIVVENLRKTHYDVLDN